MLCYYGDNMEEYRKWEDNIKMDLKQIVNDVMNWMELAQDGDHWRAIVNEEFEPSGYINHKSYLISSYVVSYAMLLWRRYGRIQEKGGQH